MTWKIKWILLLSSLFAMLITCTSFGADRVYEIIDENGKICYYDTENDVFYRPVEDQWEFQKETTLINGMQVNLAGNFYIYSYDRNANHHGVVEIGPNKAKDGKPEGPWDDNWGEDEEDGPEGPWDEGSEDEEENGEDKNEGYVGPSIDAKYAYKTVSFKFEDLTTGKEVYLPQCGESYRYPREGNVAYYFSTWVVRRNYLMGMIGNLDPQWCSALQYETHEFRISSVLAETHDYGDNWSGYMGMSDSGETYKVGAVYDNENRQELINMRPWGSVSIKSLKSSMNRRAVMPFFYEKPEKPDYQVNQLVTNEVRMELPEVQYKHDLFDVQTGIPVLEKVNLTVEAVPFALSYTLRNVGNSLERRSQVGCSYILNLEAQVGYSPWGDMLDIPCNQYLESLTYSKYNYWKVEKVNLKSLKSIQVENPAIESITFTNPKVPIDGTCKGKGDNPSGYLSYENRDVHMELGKIPLNYLIDLQKIAVENRSPLKVWNDKLEINGFLIMEDANIVTEKQESEYVTIAQTEKPHREIPALFYQPIVHQERDLEIPKVTKNGTHQTNLTVVYNQYYLDETSPWGYWSDSDYVIRESSTDRREIDFIRVHTPVVCQLSVNEKKELCQLTEPETSRRQLILGYPYELRFTRSLHSSYYGTDTFNKYTEFREIIFPFDVIIDNNKVNPAQTPIIISGQQTSLKFQIPVWVTETTYEVTAKTAAINYMPEPDYELLVEEHSNQNIVNYMATSQIPVRISGQLFDFSIHKISDTNIFEAQEERTIMVGLYDKDGIRRTIEERDTLPLMKGSSTLYEKLGILNTGMTIDFSLDTISSKLTQPEDVIQIKTDFYYINYTGTKELEVDLYYCESTDNGISYYHKLESDSPYGTFIIGDKNRAFVGEPMEYQIEESRREWIKQEMVNSRQRWYGTYHLPKQVFLVPKGMDIGIETEDGIQLSGTDDFWLKDGYLVLNFDITAYANHGEQGTQVQKSGYLSYINRRNAFSGYCNMWEREGFQYQKRDSDGTLFRLRDGDVAFYELNLRAEPWFRVGGTH